MSPGSGKDEFMDLESIKKLLDGESVRVEFDRFGVSCKEISDALAQHASKVEYQSG